jgi:hypothetical protein
VRMNFMVNTSPFAGREGKFVTTRNIKDRLDRELERNLALRVEPGETADSFTVSGRGTLHIAILIENMRREGFEFAVGPPKVPPFPSCFLDLACLPLQSIPPKVPPSPSCSLGHSCLPRLHRYQVSYSVSAREPEKA